MFMSVLGTKGYERTILEMKAQLGRKLGWDLPDKMPSASALSQARRKLDAKRCGEVMAQVYQLCSTAREHADVCYGDYRVLAVDGTHLPVPAYRAMRNHFGCPTQGAGKPPLGPQASLVTLWDVGANQPVGWRLGPYRASERVLGAELITTLKPGDLLLADRGFPSRRTITDLHQCGADFLMRLCCTGPHIYPEVAAFNAGASEDALIAFAHIKGQAPLGLRLLRQRMPDGSVAVYITTLIDQQRHPTGVLIALYAKRWRIETAFRELKLWHGLERFHARHVDGIAQEICAMMVFQLLASELEARARLQHGLTPQEQTPVQVEEPHQIQQPVVRYNRRILGDCVVRLLHAGTSGDDEIRREFDFSLFHLWRYRQKVRPGRSFPRQRQSSPRGWKDRGTKGKGRP